MIERPQTIASLMILSLLLAGVVGCAAPATQPPVLPTPTVAPGWVSDSASTAQEQCGFAINHPSNMDLVSQNKYSWILNYPATEPSVPVPNFIYVSVIPDDLQSDANEVIFNYDPGETQTLLSMQAGESRSLRDDPTLETWFTYSRLPDTMLGYQAAQTYENTQPWEFPLGTKEIRYYLQSNDCMYVVGGYIATVGSGQPGAIDEEMFDQIIASFRLAP